MVSRRMKFIVSGMIMFVIGAALFSTVFNMGAKDIYSLFYAALMPVTGIVLVGIGVFSNG